MTKEEYIISLEEIVRGELFLTNDVELQDKEISNNCWSISASQEIVDQLFLEDLEILFSRVKTNRLKQLNQSELDVGLIFYMWYDEQASQIRFNLINSNHKNLPFGVTVKLVKTQKEIIQDYLKSKYHDGIPLSELEEIKVDSEEDVIENDKNKNALNVYRELLIKENTKA